MNKENYGIRDIPNFILVFDNGEVFFFDTLKSSEITFQKGRLIISFEDACLKEKIEETIFSNTLVEVKREQFFRRVSDGSDVFTTHAFPKGDWRITLNHSSGISGEPYSAHYYLTLNEN